MLFGVRPLDLTTFAAVTILLGITAALSIAGRRGAPRESIPLLRCGTRKQSAGQLSPLG